MTTYSQQINSALNLMNVSFSSSMVQKLDQFVTLLLKWNKTYNLTRIISPEKILTHHLLDSLSILPYIQGERLIDVGTGAGFPGIPLALAKPEWQFVLLDSVGKKIRFLTQAVAELGLKNVKLIEGRVEDYHPDALFNCVIARALTRVNDMINISGHLLAPHGRLVMMKGVYPEAELTGLGYPFIVHRIEVPALNEERHVVIVSPTV